jgi:uncharacterized membrane protein required for colicin V production
MMALDLLALVVLLLFVGLGAWRGTIAGLLSTSGLVLGYLAGALSAWILGPTLAELAGLPHLLAAPIAGTAGFLAVFVVIGVAGIFVRAWDRERVREAGRTSLDRAGGACLGALRGSLIVLLLGVLSNWIHAAEVFAGRQAVEDTSPLRAMTQTLVGSGLGALLGDSPEAIVAARVIARPATSLSSLQRVFAHPRIAALADDRGFWTLVENGAVDSALNRGSFYGILHDQALRGELAEVGLVKAGAAHDPRIFREQAKEVLHEVGPRVARARRDPELHDLARDPEIAQLLQRRDVIGLLRNPHFSSTLQRILKEPTREG